MLVIFVGEILSTSFNKTTKFNGNIEKNSMYFNSKTNKCTYNHNYQPLRSSFFFFLLVLMIIMIIIIYRNICVPLSIDETKRLDILKETNLLDTNNK